MIGIIKTWLADRDFGFIEREGDADLFVHISNVRGGLNELVVGDRVEFDIGQGQKGPKAVNVRVIVNPHR